MNRRAFTLVELLTVVLVVAALAALLVVSSRGTRRTAQLNESLGNLKAIATLTASYQADNEDKFWTFSWRAGVTPDTTFSDLRAQAQSGDDLAASTAQAIDIIRRRAPGGENFPRLFNWFPHIRYSHLVLADYSGSALPLWDFVSPAHASRVAQARDPFAQGFVRSSFASSYEIGPAFFGPARADGLNGGLAQGSQHNQFSLTTNPRELFYGRPLSDVAFPSQKAFMYEDEQRHFSTDPIYFAISQSRPLVLAADGHAKVRHVAKCNPGFRSHSPSSASPTTYTYFPNASEPPIPGGGTSISVLGYLRWTRGGLQGRDFDGPEIDTSNW